MTSVQQVRLLAARIAALVTQPGERPGLETLALIELAAAIREAGGQGGPVSLTAAVAAGAFSGGIPKDLLLDTVAACYDMCVADEITRVGS